MTVTSAELEDADRRLTWLYMIGGAIGLLAAVVLLIEKVALLEDPTYVPSCSINPVLSCGSIMRTSQAEAFGFPNPLIGVAAFPVVVTTGVAMVAGAAFRRWYWRGLLTGTVAGLVFVHWLIFQSLYRIGALCPYCMVVWVVTIPLFLYTALHLAQSSPALERSRFTPIVRLATTYHGVILTIWYLAIAGLIARRFWNYWSTLL